MCRFDGVSEGFLQTETNVPGYNVSSSQVDTDCEEPHNSDDHDSADESSGSDDDDAESARGDDIHSEDNYSVG